MVLVDKNLVKYRKETDNVPQGALFLWTKVIIIMII